MSKINSYKEAVQVIRRSQRRKDMQMITAAVSVVFVLPIAVALVLRKANRDKK